MSRTISLIINESEITAGTRGSSLGPQAMKVVARNKNSKLFSKYETTTIQTENHLLDDDVKYPKGKRIHGLVKIYERVSHAVAKIRNSGNFILICAADHGSAGGTIAGLKVANLKHRIGVLWIDAHGDLHTPYTTTSGNMHGMSLSTTLAENNLESKVNDINADTAEMWDELINIGGIRPKIKDTDLAFIGVRDLEQPEVELMTRRNIKNFTVVELREKSVNTVIEELEEKYKECDEIYVSFDVDSMDPKHTSHGTGTPADNGLTPKEVEQILLHFANHKKVNCIEFAEVNPCLDEKTNKMAEIAFDLFEKVANKVNPEG